jgi:hypothetical protein
MQSVDEIAAASYVFEAPASDFRPCDSNRLLYELIYPWHPN